MSTTSQPGFETIPGQENAVSTLTAFLSSGNIPHAIIFSGISGSGKKAAAKAFAMAANCRHSETTSATGMLPCGRCRACRTISTDRHPDIHHLAPAGKMIKVEQIRQLRDAIAMKPFEATTRMVIIDDAHVMNTPAANALLKSLEEPPPDTVFLLLTDQPGRMLPTVVSRCQVVRFTPLSAEVILNGLSAIDHLSPEDRELIARLAGGSMRAAEIMAAPSWRQHRRMVLGLMASIDTLPPGLLLALAAHLADAAVPVLESMAIMETWIRDVLVADVFPNRLINVDLMEKIKYSAEHTTAETTLHRAQAIRQARRRLDGNANVKLTVEHLLLDMASGPSRQAPSGKMVL